MFGLPAEATWVWVGLVVGTAVMFGVVTGHPGAPPDATTAASTIDQVAATTHPSTASVSLRADEVTVGQHRIGLRGPGGTAHATLEYGPVVPVRPGSKLESVLEGTPVRSAYSTPASFEYALAAAEERDADWQPAGPVLRIRRVRYGEVNSVLVGT